MGLLYESYSQGQLQIKWLTAVHGDEASWTLCTDVCVSKAKLRDSES